MILTCQKCSTSFRLDETLLKATGSKVRCSLCQTIWVALPPETSLEDSLESDDGGIGIGAAAFAGAGAVAGAALAGGSEESADEAEDQLETPSELKFFADGDIDEELSDDDELVTDEINLDELDHLLSEEDDRMPAPLPDEDFKTEELNLADLEKMLDLETDQEPPEKENAQPEPEELELGEDLADDLAAADLEREDSVIEELDLDLEDLETLLEEDTGLGDEIAAVEESTGGLDEAIEGFDLDDSDVAKDDIELDMAPGLEELLEDDGKAPVVEETEEIAVSEITDAVEAPESQPASDAGEDLELDFELAPELDGLFDEGDDQDVAIEETEELDFSQLGADLAQADEEPAEAEQDGKATPEGSADQLGEAADEDDLELEFEEDALSDGGLDDSAIPELDLSELSQALEEGGPETVNAVDDVEEPELELEMDTDVAEDGDAEDLALDMEDFDLTEAAESSEVVGDGIEETRELDIDELESLLEGSGDAPEAEEEASSDSLELDIDLDGLDGGDDDDMEDATRELDLNDIEKILEMDAAGGEADAEPVEASQDLDLDLDMDNVPPPAPEIEETGEETTGTDNEFDLSELEKMLDVEDTTDAPSDADEDLDDLDLDFDLQPATDESDDLDLEFDMLDEEPGEASALFDTSESEDLGLDLDSGVAGGIGDDAFESDLDFEIMDEDLAVEEVDLDIDAEDIGAATLSEPVAAGAIGASADMRNRDLTQELMDEMAAADTQTMAAPPVEAKPIKPPPMKKKKKSSKSLVLLFILILLGAAVYLLPKYTDIKLPAIKMPDLSGIPFIGDFMGRQSPEAIVPVEASLKGDWVQNQQAGRLYTIQGQVKNMYADARSYIRVTGRVYANGRKFQQAAKAYCGNILTADELATLSLADIQKKLSNRIGSNNSNVKVASGKTVPFLVVFGELPPEIELQEFAVEISGSLPVAASK
jgi:pilus assembly protein FimV